MNLASLLSVVYGTAAVPLLHFSTTAVRRFLSVRTAVRNTVPTRARIVDVRVMNEAHRRIPFVKLQVEVFGEEGIADAEGFFSHEEAMALQTGGVIWVRCFPSGRVSVVKNVPRNAVQYEEGVALPRYASPYLAI